MSGGTDESAGRRSFLRQTGMLFTGAALIFPFGQRAWAQQDTEPERTPGERVFPTENLLREHGVLSRIFLIYENIQGRLDSEDKVTREALATAAGLIHGFIENYHERLEEDHVFPRFEKAGILADLVKVLREQHKAGRRLTESIKRHSGTTALREPGERKRLREKLSLYSRMYRPHAAREDTVLLPALRSILSPDDFDVMGEEFEDREQALFGVGGFEKIVEQVADLERSLGVYELAQFTADTR